MKTDVREKDDQYELAVDLPGFSKDEISAELKDGYLTIRASKGLDKDEKDKDGRYIRRERYCGQCQRSFYAVSYTHLDVYKRQGRHRSHTVLHAAGHIVDDGSTCLQRPLRHLGVIGIHRDWDPDLPPDRLQHRFKPRPLLLRADRDMPRPGGCLLYTSLYRLS